MTAVLPDAPAHDRPEKNRRGINLVAAARPYFGLIVLTSLMLSVLGIFAMLRIFPTIRSRTPPRRKD